MAGANVLGKVTQIEPVPRSRDIVSYTFVVDGRIFIGKAGVPAAVERNLQQSDALTIRYLPSDPTINHPAEWEWSLLSNVVGIVFLIVFASIFALFPIAMYRRRELVAEGKAAIAIVTGCAVGRSAFCLKYEFRTDTGSLVKGGGRSRIRREIGASIWILYLPKNPGRNHPYPFPDYAVER